MKQVLFILLLVAVSSITQSQASAPATMPQGSTLAGKWKANLTKSQQHVNHQFKSASMRIDVTDKSVTITFSGVNMSGQEESGTREVRPDGKEYPIAQAPDMSETTRWVTPNMLESVAKKDGKVIGQGSYEVSADGKTLTAKIKGIDASGSTFEQVIVFDRES